MSDKNILGKIPTMFERDWASRTRPVIDKITPGCEWVAAGEGWATKKYDGTPVAIINGVRHKRRDMKPGREMPPGWFPAQPELDPVTQEQPGWVPLDPVNKEDRRMLECAETVDGTYEFIGPTVNGNPENCPTHELIRHGLMVFPDVPRDFVGLFDWLKAHDVEGIVWYHPDGRMAKIKQRDFGLKRSSERSEAP